MITIFVDNCNSISQNSYDKVIQQLPFHSLTCTCGHSGGLSIHGYYSRAVKFGTDSFRLKVCRVRCSVCGRTHALLPSIIVPYSSVLLPDQVRILSCSASGQRFDFIMEATPSIDESSIRYIIRQYRLHWEQRLLSQGITLSDLPCLVLRCLACFHRQFMQIKKTPNIFFLSPT